MKLMITGINGQLGWELARQVASLRVVPVLLDRHALDITDPAKIAQVIKKEAPSLLINAAAYTRVDHAETEKDAAYRINGDAPGHLAKCCKLLGIPMIHISTDYVFDGTQASPYAESAPICPTGIYGLSKAEGEKQIRETLSRHLIIRTSWVYGIHGNNFVKTMLRLGKEKQQIGIVADQHGCPTAAADLAAALLNIAQRILQKDRIPWGTYHYCGRGITTWYDFALQIFYHAHRFDYPHHPELKSITSAEYPTPAIRPAFSALDCSNISNHLGIRIRPWEESLVTVLKEILSQP